MRVGTTILFLFLGGAGAVTPVAAAAQGWPGMSRHQIIKRWLRSEHEKVKKDSEQLVEDTRKLRTEVEKQKGNPIPEKIFKRVLALERKAVLLRSEVARVDENFLSVPVVQLAEEIREEGKALQAYFEDNLSGQPQRKLSSLADSIEDRADDIGDRMRLP